MDKKLINKEIRKVSNFTSLPILVHFIASYALILMFQLGFILLDKIGISISEDAQYLVLIIISGVVVILLALLSFYPFRKKSTGLTLKGCFRKPQMSAWWVTKWLVLGTGFAYITSIASSLFFTLLEKLLDIKLTPIDVDFGQTPLRIFTMVLAVVVFAPIFEELLFRGTLYRNTEVMGQPFSIIVTGIAFGLWHMNYTQVIFAAVIGMISSYIYAKTRSIIPSMILHFIINFTSTLAALGTIGVDENRLDNVEYILEKLPQFAMLGTASMIMFGSIILAIVVLIVEIVTNREQFKLKKSVFPIPTFKRIAVFFSAPLTIITVLLMLGMTVYNAFNS